MLWVLKRTISMSVYDQLSKAYVRPLVKSVYQKKIFCQFSTKTYVVGTQKNRLNEAVLLGTQNIC